MQSCLGADKLSLDLADFQPLNLEKWLAGLNPVAFLNIQIGDPTGNQRTDISAFLRHGLDARGCHQISCELAFQRFVIGDLHQLDLIFRQGNNIRRTAMLLAVLFSFTLCRRAARCQQSQRQ